MGVFRKFILHPLPWIFLLALFLRTWSLGTVPYGFHVDEVKVGWNAYSLWKTARDDWWHLLPQYYDSFGDQRPTGIMYASVPSLALFGLNEFAVRFTPALFGSLGVVAVYFLTKSLTDKENLKLKIENFAALMAAVSPWHIALSRATSEGVIASTLIIFGLVFLLRKKPHFVLSGIFFVSSYFFYHSARLLVPVFAILATAYLFLRNRRLSLPHTLLSFFLLLFTLAFAISPTARARLNQVSVFADLGVRDELDRLPFEEGPDKVLLARMFHNKAVLYSTRFIDEYFSYFSPKFFLSFGEAKPARYQTVLRGPLMYIEFLLLAIGLIAAARKLNLRSPLLLLLLLLLASPLPAALTTEDAPNLHRALLLSPFIAIFAGIGLSRLKKLSLFAFYFSLLLLFVDFVYYSHLYLVHNRMRDSLAITRNSGTGELIKEIVPQLSFQYDHVYLTNRPDPLYTWFAFYGHLQPFSFNQLLAVSKSNDFTYENITFTQFRCPSSYISDRHMENVAAVDTEGCAHAPDTIQIAQVRRKSGGTPFTVWTYLPPTGSTSIR